MLTADLDTSEQAHAVIDLPQIDPSLISQNALATSLIGKLPVAAVDPKANSPISCRVEGSVAIFGLHEFDPHSSFPIDKRLTILLQQHACMQRVRATSYLLATK